MSRRPTLTEVLSDSIRYFLNDFSVCLPGRIEKYDAVTQKADVKPLIQKQYVDGETQPLPIVVGVPVVFPGAGNRARLNMSVLEPGDFVLMLFCDRAIDKWVQSGRDLPPPDRRQHDLTDAIAIAGLNPFTGFDNPEPDVVGISYKDAKFRLQPDGRITIGNAATELLDILDRTLTEISAITVTVSGVPTPINNIPNFVALRAELSLLKGSQ